jgi:hypothetical protein
VNAVYTPPVRSKTPEKIWEDGHIGWHTQFNQKFAELIVRECVSVGDRAFCSDHSVVPVFPAEKIKHHFGVEE